MMWLNFFKNPYLGSHLDSGVCKNFADFTLVFECMLINRFIGWMVIGMVDWLCGWLKLPIGCLMDPNDWKIWILKAKCRWKWWYCVNFGVFYEKLPMSASTPFWVHCVKVISTSTRLNYYYVTAKLDWL